MHATVRHLKTQSGKAQEVGSLIQAEYLPLIQSVAGFVSYTLVALSDDEISSLGLFESSESADEANALAQNWAAERLGPLMAAPLEASEGTVIFRAP